MKINKKNRKLIGKIRNTVLLLGSFAIGLVMYVNNEDSIITYFSIKKQKIVYARAYEKLTYFPQNNNVMGVSNENQNAESLPVLVYHGIKEVAKDQEDVSYKTFQEQLFWLKDNGYSTITTEELDGFLSEGKSLPRKSFLLTFDDGRKDSFYPVDSTLKELGFNAVMFVISAEALNSNNNFHLTIRELQYLISTGRWEIQSHSDNEHQVVTTGPNGETGHSMSNKRWLTEHDRLETDEEYKRRIYDDLQNSKEILERKLNQKIKGFAVPFGDFGQNQTNYSESKKVILDAAKSIYKYIYFSPWDEIGNRNYPKLDTLMVRRIDVDKDISTQKLIQTLENSEDKNIDYSDNFQKDNGWLTDWGFSNTVDNSLHLYPDPGSNGVTTYLDGTQLWDNFEANVKPIISVDTNTFTFISRADRLGNYAFCSFSRNSVNYGEKKNNKFITGNTRNIGVTFNGKTEVGIRISGNVTQCLVNRISVLSNKVTGLDNNKGMIGFSIWSPNTHAEAFIKSFTSVQIQ